MEIIRINPKRVPDFETQWMLPQRRMLDLISGNIPIPSVFFSKRKEPCRKGHYIGTTYDCKLVLKAGIMLNMNNVNPGLINP